MPQRFIRRSHKIIIHCILFTFNESVGIGTNRLDVLTDSVRISGTPKSNLKEAFLKNKGDLLIAKFIIIHMYQNQLGKQIVGKIGADRELQKVI